MIALIALSSALFVLSVLSGMLGIGVAFAAIPVLSLVLPDLVNQVHPLSLLLNGVTAFFSLIGFAQAGLVDWRRAVLLSLVTTAGAPLGAWCARLVADEWVWAAYLLAVAVLLYNLFAPTSRRAAGERFGAIMAWAFPVSVLSGFIGVGPGFMLVPLALYFGIGIKRAAALNAFAVTPSSFAAVLPHWGHAQLPASLVLPLLAAGAAGALLGSRIAGTRISPETLRRIFAATVLAISAYRIARFFF